MHADRYCQQTHFWMQAQIYFNWWQSGDQDHRDVRLSYIDHTSGKKGALKAGFLYWIEGEITSGSLHELPILTFESGSESLIEPACSQPEPKSIQVFSSGVVVRALTNANHSTHLIVEHQERLVHDLENGPIQISYQIPKHLITHQAGSQRLEGKTVILLGQLGGWSRSAGKIIICVNAGVICDSLAVGVATKDV
ncbi:hypothetical protein PCANC_24397 [Puccinia coronata f. sp. avenae]|uniref:Uncharacterized protein n=1 Tax=Puccinia coronata f. sp. avenae TaxID=200324 RepID=A0A2N5TYI8_9BASI|nr:hypothetical protein PCANC_24397 [Puccinia coronata f. sp. avenae]